MNFLMIVAQNLFVYGQVINLLTLVGLRTVFGVAGPSVTNLLTLAGLCLKPKSVHKPARVSRFVTLGLTTLKSVHKPDMVSRFVTAIRKVSKKCP